MTHKGIPLTKGHHYCVGGPEDWTCCRCGDESPYRPILARICPGPSATEGGGKA